MFTVKVVETSTGRQVKGSKVMVGFDVLLRGFTKAEYTNSDGEVHFDNDNGTGTIYVDGKRVYEGRIEGRKVIYI